MFVSIPQMTENLKSLTRWQKTPRTLDDSDYRDMMLRAYETLLIDTGRASTFTGFENKIVDGELVEAIDIEIDEKKYMLIVAQIEFFKMVQCDVNNIVSYSTDALSITNADKPYAHLQDSIAELENERRIVYYKMCRFAAQN